MHNKLCIPASGNTKRTAHIRFTDMQADVCSTASGTARNSVICCEETLRRDLTRNNGGTLTGKTEDVVLKA